MYDKAFQSILLIIDIDVYQIFLWSGQEFMLVGKDIRELKPADGSIVH